MRELTIYILTHFYCNKQCIYAKPEAKNLRKKKTLNQWFFYTVMAHWPYIVKTD